jgi:hypothetical protein
VDRDQIAVAHRREQAREQAAADDYCSLTSLIEKLLHHHLKRRGYLPKE